MIRNHLFAWLALLVIALPAFSCDPPGGAARAQARPTSQSQPKQQALIEVAQTPIPELINAERNRVGLESVRVDPAMMTKTYEATLAASKRTDAPLAELRDGMPFVANVARSYGAVRNEEVVAAWMRDQKTRDRILSKGYVDCGFARVGNLTVLTMK